MSRLKVAVVGSGISGLSAAWLLSQRHDVTLFEREPRFGGHSHTVDALGHDGVIPIDTGFIVFNPLNYPNLTRLFDHLGVETAASDMSFAVSLDDGAVEYGGGTLGSLFAQRRNLVNPRFWSMLRDLTRFYKTAPAALRAGLDDAMTLGQFLDRHAYGDAFRNDHLLPMAGAIWSASPEALADYPVASFIRFFENHGLLKFSDRPPWRTVKGGSRAYVEKLARAIQTQRVATPVTSISRSGGHVHVSAGGSSQTFDRVLLATHADESLRLLSDASPREREVLSRFTYTSNRAVLHCDGALMPKRKGVWSSWNYFGSRDQGSRDICVTYWMNRLQPLATGTQFFVTLNPVKQPKAQSIISTHMYDHPVFTTAALQAQRELSSLQGCRNTWFAGAYFGSGFHEDGLRSGLAAAEALGGVRRPWRLDAGPRPVGSGLEVVA